MAEYNDSNDGLETILNISDPSMSVEKYLPAFHLSRGKIHALYKQSTTEEIYDDVRLKYFKLPKPTSYPIDLNQGYEQHIRRFVGQSFHLLKVIKFILESEENIINAHNFGKAQTLNIDEGGRTPLPPKRKLVLSHWGVLSRIMTIPYRLNKKNTTFYATRYCGILHLIDDSTFFEKKKHHTYHGKFEQACFSDDPDLEPATDVPVNRKDSTIGVFRSTLKEYYDLIYSADLSGIISEHKINDIHNMDEINQCKFIQTKLLAAKDNFLKHPNCLLWWAQFYLTNTNDVCIGLRDRDGVMRTPSHLLKIQDIPKNQKWLPEVCIRFLNTMLTLIEEKMSKVNCPYTVYEFKFDSFAKCIKLKINNGKNDLSFLPENYIEHCKQQMNT